MSICVCDEAHKCLATETYYALDDFMISYDEEHPKTLIGLTATPGRKYRDSLLEGDNLDLALMFDQHIFSILCYNVGGDFNAPPTCFYFTFFSFQILCAYSSILRSAANLPAAAILSSDIRFHLALSR